MRIALLGLRAIPPGLSAKDMEGTVDTATRERVIDAIVAKLAEYYVDPEAATKMEVELRQQQRSAAYDVAEDAQTFANMLTDHLRAVSHDKHLLVAWAPNVLPEGDPAPTAEDKARMREQLERMNCFFSKAEKLDGDIGYLKLDGFAEVDVCGPKVTAAFA